MKNIFIGFMMAILSLGTTTVYAQKSANSVKSTQEQQLALKELTDLFFAAAKTGNQEVINEFLKHGFPVNTKNHAGFTPLMMAAYYGHQPIVTTLLEHGADRCLRDNKGNTALMGAMFKLEWSIVKQLRKVDCDVNAKKQGLKTSEEFAKVLGQESQLKKIAESYKD